MSESGGGRVQSAARWLRPRAYALLLPLLLLPRLLEAIIGPSLWLHDAYLPYLGALAVLGFAIRVAARGRSRLSPAARERAPDGSRPTLWVDGRDAADEPVTLVLWPGYVRVLDGPQGRRERWSSRADEVELVEGGPPIALRDRRGAVVRVRPAGPAADLVGSLLWAGVVDARSSGTVAAQAIS